MEIKRDVGTINTYVMEGGCRILTEQGDDLIVTVGGRYSRDDVQKIITHMQRWLRTGSLRADPEVPVTFHPDHSKGEGTDELVADLALDFERVKGERDAYKAVVEMWGVWNRAESKQ